MKTGISYNFLISIIQYCQLGYDIQNVSISFIDIPDDPLSRSLNFENWKIIIKGFYKDFCK